MAGEISFTPTRDDMVAVARGSFRRSLRRRRFAVRLLIILAIAAGAGAVFGWYYPLIGIAWGAGVAVVYAAVWLALMLGTWDLLLPRRVGRLFAQQRVLHRAFNAHWDDTAWTQSWDAGSSRTAWADYHDWIETDRIVAFGVSEQLYHLAPKRAMTPEQLADLRATAAARIGGQAGQR